jgi:CRP-like cAMP-binding protein
VTITTIERVVALHRVPMFADIPGRTLAAVAQRAQEVAVATGESVIVEGAMEDHLFAVVQGRLRVHQGDRTVASLGAGSTVGELAALVPEPRSASVTALEPTLLLRIDKAILDELLADRPALASGVIEALVAMVRERTHTEADTSSG